VCFWALLVIPRTDIPMCWNCYARLRQDEDLVGEKLVIRKIIVRAALQSAKIVNKVSRNPNIVLDRISQESLLIVDLYRAGAKSSVETTTDSSPMAFANPLVSEGSRVAPGLTRSPTKRNAPKIEAFRLTRRARREQGNK